MGANCCTGSRDKECPTKSLFEDYPISLGHTLTKRSSQGKHLEARILTRPFTEDQCARKPEKISPVPPSLTLDLEAEYALGAQTSRTNKIAQSPVQTPKDFEEDSTKSTSTRRSECSDDEELPQHPKSLHKRACSLVNAINLGEADNHMLQALEGESTPVELREQRLQNYMWSQQLQQLKQNFKTESPGDLKFEKFDRYHTRSSKLPSAAEVPVMTVNTMKNKQMGFAKARGMMVRKVMKEEKFWNPRNSLKFLNA